MATTPMTLADYMASINLTESKLRKALKDVSHLDRGYEAISSMFVRRGLPEELDGADRIEEWLLKYGAVGYVKADAGSDYPGSKSTGTYKRSEYRVGWAAFGSDPYPDGIGSAAIISGYDGYVRCFDDWRNNPDIVVAFNNHTRTPDLTIPMMANMLTEYDISLMYQIYYSRLYPIPVAKDEKTRLALQQALDNMQVGKYTTIMSDNMINVLTGDGSSAQIDIVQLSDPKASDHIQYLDHGVDDIKRWFWNTYGLNVSASAKMAQQSVAETTSGDDQSMVIPHARYHERQKEAEQLKTKFGWDVTIEFSEPWQNAYAKCTRELEGGEMCEDDEQASGDGGMEALGDDQTAADSNTAGGSERKGDSDGSGEPDKRDDNTVDD